MSNHRVELRTSIIIYSTLWPEGDGTRQRHQIDPIIHVNLETVFLGDLIEHMPQGYVQLLYRMGSISDVESAKKQDFKS
jgi:hypothetical protein